ncbi:MAG: STAS domain-containing protein [Pseudomonadota bacterium]
MSHTSAKNNDAMVLLRLSKKLTMHDAIQLKDVLLEAGTKQTGVSLDFQDVLDVKTPLAQVLVAGERFFKKRNLPFQLLNADGVLKGLFSDLGLEAEFKIMENSENG